MKKKVITTSSTSEELLVSFGKRIGEGCRNLRATVDKDCLLEVDYDGFDEKSPSVEKIELSAGQTFIYKMANKKKGNDTVGCYVKTLYFTGKVGTKVDIMLWDTPVDDTVIEVLNPVVGGSSPAPVSGLQSKDIELGLDDFVAEDGLFKAEVIHGLTTEEIKSINVISEEGADLFVSYEEVIVEGVRQGKANLYTDVAEVMTVTLIY